MPRERKAKVRSPLRTATSPEGTFDSPIEDIKQAGPTKDLPPKKAKTALYVVRKGHKISVEKGVYSPEGTVVSMDKKMAKHYIKHGCIDAYVDDDDDEDDDA